MTPSQMDSISPLIYKAIKAAIAEEMEKEIGQVQKRVEEAVRGRVGDITARVLERFAMSRHEFGLRIEVSFEGVKP